MHLEWVQPYYSCCSDPYSAAQNINPLLTIQPVTSGDYFTALLLLNCAVGFHTPNLTLCKGQLLKGEEATLPVRQECIKLVLPLDTNNEVIMRTFTILTSS